MQIVILGGERYEAHTCISCGVWYVVPEVVMAHQRKAGGFHHCSNGHGQGWDEDGDTENSRLRRERDRLKQETAHLNDLRLEAERATEREAQKRRKIERRISGGVCPCCNRHFAKLEMHMKSRHPEIGVLPKKESA